MARETCPSDAHDHSSQAPGGDHAPVSVSASVFDLPTVKDLLAGWQTEWNSQNRFYTTRHKKRFLECGVVCWLFQLLHRQTSVGLWSKFVYGQQAGAILRAFAETIPPSTRRASEGTIRLAFWLRNAGPGILRRGPPSPSRARRFLSRGI
jgi:hypothetical protein